MATEASLGIAQTGSSEVAGFQQTWTIGGTPTTVYIQALAVTDPTNNIAATVDANGLHIFPVLGTPNTSGSMTATNIAPAGSATLLSPTPITIGKTGTLQRATFSSTQPMLWVLQTVNNAGAPTTVDSFYTNAYETLEYVTKMANEISTALSSTTDCAFQVVATNQGTNALTPATVYAAFFWAEN